MVAARYRPEPNCTGAAPAGTIWLSWWRRPAEAARSMLSHTRHRRGVVLRAPGKASEGGHMLFDFTEAERNTARRALEIYVTELREEIVKTERS
jgi:hypothetical protein